MAKIIFMMKKIFKKKEQGYAILFTVVIVSAISVITAGLSNAIYKQLILSSLAKDSQTAFYQSDTATDCALLADRVVKDDTENYPGFATVSGVTWSCGGVTMLVNPVGPSGSYTIYPTAAAEAANTPCYRINVTKDISASPIVKTEILAKGYNICNRQNIRTVEREIKISYEE